jgi:hypothetical protein
MANNEQERVKRLRERQLTDRDPLVKQRQIQHTTAQKERKARGKRYTLGEAWRTIPHVYRSPFIGLLLGVVAMFVIPAVWDSPWSFWIAVGATVFFVFLGIFTGSAQDTRDNLRDSIKH